MENLFWNNVPLRIYERISRFKRKKIEKKFEGDEVACTICHSKYREFGRIGVKKRPNAKCHNCGSLERHRLIWKYLCEKELLKAPISLLHFAPEKAFYEIFSSLPNIEYFPCDLDPKKYNSWGKAKVSKVDVTNIPYGSGKFDLILCNHVLEHVPDDKLAMSELFRVMKQGGSGIFQVPIDYQRAETYEDFSIVTPKGRLKAFGQHDHVRWYGRDYGDRLRRAGFHVVEDDFVKGFSEKEQYKYGLMDTELIYLCKKLGD